MELGSAVINLKQITNYLLISSSAKCVWKQKKKKKTDIKKRLT